MRSGGISARDRGFAWRRPHVYAAAATISTPIVNPAMRGALDVPSLLETTRSDTPVVVGCVDGSTPSVGAGTVGIRVVGVNVGIAVGKNTGARVGAVVGGWVGLAVWRRVGTDVGISVGRAVGALVGAVEGIPVGEYVGGEVGDGVGSHEP